MLSPSSSSRRIDDQPAAGPYWPRRVGRAFAVLASTAWALPAVAQPGPAATSPTPEITTFTDDRPKGDDKSPQFRAEQRLKRLSRMSADKLDEQVDTLKELIAASPDDDPDKPDYYLNLADAYWEKSEQAFERAYDEQLEASVFEADKAGNAALATRLKAEQQGYLAEQQQWRERTVETYKIIEKKFPDSPKLDEVLYYLGLHLTLVGRDEEGYQHYVRLIQKRPNSTYIPDALVNIGEYFFNRNEFDTAFAFYDKVMTGFPTSNVYGFALYKKAWCHFNMGEYDEALDAFLRVIQYSDSDAASKLTSRFELKKEAQKDLVRAYSMTGNPDRAIMFFKEIAPELYLELGASLADLYASQDKSKDAIALYKYLIKEQPSSYKVLHYQRQIVNTTYRGQDKKATVTEVERMLALYQKIGPTAPADWLATEKGEVEGELRVIATTWHKEAQKTLDDFTLDQSHHLYREYLRLFPDGEHAYAITMNYAILLYQLKKYDLAAEQFERSIELDPNGKFTPEAAHSALLSYYKVMDVNAGSVKPETEDDVIQQEIPPMDAKMVRACKRYIDIAGPDAEDVPEATYAAGKIYYNYNHFEEAIPYLEAMVTRYKTHPAAPESAKLLLSAYNLKHDFKGLEQWAMKLANTNLASGDLQVTIKRIRDQAEFNRCFEFEQTKEYDTAAECFMKYADAYPDTALLDRALFNAAVNFTRAKRIEKAIFAHGELYNRRTDSPLAPKALYAIGEIYRNLAVYSEASKFYEIYAQNHPKDKYVEQALRYASMFRKALGEYDQAIADYNKYLTMFPKNENAPNVFFDIGLIYESQKRWKDVQKHFETYLTRYAKGPADLTMGAHLKVAVALWNTKQEKLALKRLEKVLETFNGLSQDEKSRLTTGISYLAESRFMVGEKVLADFREAKLRGKTLEQDFQLKLKLIGEAKDIFIEVIKLNQPHWVIAGLSRVGLAYQELAEAIEQAPPPPGFNQEQQEMYREDLAAKADNIKAEAVTAYKECLDTAKQLQWFNHYAEQAEQSLAKLDYNFKFIKEYKARPGYYKANATPPSFLRPKAPAQGDDEQPTQPGPAGQPTNDDGAQPSQAEQAQ
ncbi:MAG: hypothetical protein AMXMBFR64_25920 [Myxococcales bacterium]